MIHKVLGIDPGLDGGLAFLTQEGQLKVYRMPTRPKIMASGKKRREIDEDRLATIIRLEAPSVAWVEDVHAIGGKASGRRADGVVGAFAFGEGKGILKGVLGALGVLRRYVTPSVWKDRMRLSSDKDLSIARAQRLFPTLRAELKHDGCAEAALLAVYGLTLTDTAPLKKKHRVPA